MGDIIFGAVISLQLLAVIIYSITRQQKEKRFE